MAAKYCFFPLKMHKKKRFSFIEKVEENRFLRDGKSL